MTLILERRDDSFDGIYRRMGLTLAHLWPNGWTTKQSRMSGDALASAELIKCTFVRVYTDSYSGVYQLNGFLLMKESTNKRTGIKINNDQASLVQIYKIIHTCIYI